VRTIGRVLLHSQSLSGSGENLLQVLSGIKDKINNDKINEPKKEIQAQIHLEGGLTCYVFGTLAGGTCSGIMSDLGFLIKAGLGYQTNLIGTFLLGDVCYDGKSEMEIRPLEKAAQRTNTIYGLAELVFLHTDTGFQIAEPEWCKRIGNIDLSGGDYQSIFNQKPYNTITVVGAKNDDGYSLNTQGNNLVAYYALVGRYYAQFLTSAAFRKEQGRLVDQEAQETMTADVANPSRPNNFQRLGCMSLRVPTEKIKALVDAEIAGTLGADFIKNADMPRCGRLETEFLSRVGWDALLSDQSGFVPLDGLDLQAGELPDRAEEFRSVWEQSFLDITNHYALYTDPGSGMVSAKVSEFKGAKSGPAIQAMLDNLLGQNAGARLSLGSLKWLLEKLTTQVSSKLTSLENAIKGMQAELHGSDKRNLTQAFRECLDEQCQDFPEKSINPFSMLKRRSWGGGADVASALTLYRDKLRAYAVHTVVKSVLDSMEQELLKISTTRKLVARYVVRGIIKDHSSVDAAFGTESSVYVTQQEVISDREEIGQCLVQPLLAKKHVDSGATLKTLALDAILVKWAGRDGDGIKGTWDQIAKLLDSRKGKVADAGSLATEETFQTALSQLQEMLEIRYSSELEKVFKPAIEQLSVWDSLRLYVEKTGNDPDTVLKNLFSVYLSRAKFFTRLSDDKGVDTTKLTPSVSYICNTEDANACFKMLKINNSAYLSELMSHALKGAMINPLPMKDPPRNEILIFLKEKGRLPYFYAEFREIRRLLSNTSVQKPDSDKNWSDKRFPEWIRKWWGKDPKPFFLAHE
jgi:hypothetical protein